MSMTPEQATGFKTVVDRLVENVEQVILGKTHVVRLAFTAMLSEGHLLLEDFPGTGKTSLARAMAQSVKGTHSRIQFTPDLLPGDITGVSIFDQKAGVFEFHTGPIFANIVHHVTVDGITHQVSGPFMVIATQNPIEQAGTYRLPEAQLDRFLMKTSLGYPDHASTLRILEGSARPDARELDPVVPGDMVVKLSALARTVHVDPEINDYVSRLVEGTRRAPEVRLGVSVRGALALLKASRVFAAAHGRHFVLPDDVKSLADSVFAHRLVLDPEAEFDGVTANNVIGQILIDTPIAPRVGE
jgi:MoxR-like ATPase